MNYFSYGIVAIIIFSILITTDFVFANESFMFPDWIKQAIKLWTEGKISDSEFLYLTETALNKKIIPAKTSLEPSYVIPQESRIQEKTGGKITTNDYDRVPPWVKERAVWWIEQKISDDQFLRVIHYLQNVGYINYNPEIHIIAETKDFKSELELFLLTESDILKITNHTNWRTVSTDYDFQEGYGIEDSVKVLLKDITRVYEPIFYKYKVPSMMVQILEFGSKVGLESYWNTLGTDKKSVFDNAHLLGKPYKDSECLFSYSSQGAITACSYDNMIVQAVIFDPHNEHYLYSLNDLKLDRTELTSRFVGEMLEKISNYKKIDSDNDLHKILKKDKTSYDLDAKEDSLLHKENSKKQHIADPERAKGTGIENFSCIRDDFGLVTISGVYNNGNTRKDMVNLQVTFLDNTDNLIGTTSTSLYDLHEFESRRFLGHSKWNEPFITCKIEVN